MVIAVIVALVVGLGFGTLQRRRYRQGKVAIPMPPSEVGRPPTDFDG